MAQEQVILVNSSVQRWLEAQEKINNNFNECYAALPPSLTGEALKYLRVKADESGVEWAAVTGGSGLTQAQVLARQL